MKRRFPIYSLLVISFISSCEEIINVPDISEDSVTILAPTEGTELLDDPVTFFWEDIDGADAFQLQIATPSFAEASQILLDSLVNDTRFTKTLDPHVYEWRIRAVNASYETPYIATKFSVKKNLTDETVQLLTPADSGVEKEGTISFSWEKVQGAENYRLEIATPDFTNATEIVLDTLINTSSFNQNLTKGTYTWRVKALNSLSETTYEIRSLTVEE